MRPTQTHYNQEGYTALFDLIYQNNYSNLVILVDSNTTEHCLPVFVEKMGDDMPQMDLLEIPAGENHKNIYTCTDLWTEMTNSLYDRKTLLINLGGGVLTDMGGFVAAAYKRGIDWVNFPTTLLSMVDASTGGKLGIDFGSYKNQIGFFENPIFTAIDPDYLSTLPEQEVRSGFAEMIKHGLIADASHFDAIRHTNLSDIQTLKQHIADSVNIKKKVVAEDPKESGLRKILNYGHTIGHAIESWSWEEGNTPLLHGEAIAVGMICEAYLSPNLSKEELSLITQYLSSIYPKVVIDTSHFDRIYELCKQDKKNTHQTIHFVGLDSIGKANYNLTLNEDKIKASLDYYHSV